MKDTLAQTVLVYVHLTASMAIVDTRTDRVLPVLKDGWVVIVQPVILHLFLLNRCKECKGKTLHLKKKQRKNLLKANKKISKAKK